MNTQTRTYYRHARSIGAFRAIDALRLAREASALDDLAASRRLPPPVDVAHETAYGSTVRMSRAVRIY